MTHWLDVVRATAADLKASSPADDAPRALIVGDPAYRAADACDAAGLLVVRAIPPHGSAVRRFDRRADDAVVRVSPDRLPFPDGTFDLVIAQATIEFNHDDRLVVQELARVARSGGRLVLRLPRRGPLTAVDALNLARYTREITGRGTIPVEALPIGWRRHYHRGDLDAILKPAAITVDRIASGGWAIGELAYAPMIVATRALIPRPALAQRLRGVYTRLGDLDEHLPGPAMWVIEATRR
ncbi:MAG TPA: methyltransferase domain-containing protein [Thermomicrobiales bacterium]|nr:methyltransferase domain-containing protein [Thermomicrobiales bacterium]